MLEPSILGYRNFDKSDALDGQGAWELSILVSETPIRSLFYWLSSFRLFLLIFWGMPHRWSGTFRFRPWRSSKIFGDWRLICGTVQQIAWDGGILWSFFQRGCQWSREDYISCCGIWISRPFGSILTCLYRRWQWGENGWRCRLASRTTKSIWWHFMRY